VAAVIVPIVLIAFVLILAATWVVERRRRRRLVALAEQGKLTTAQTDELIVPGTIDGQVVQAVASLEAVLNPSTLKGGS